MSLRELWLQTKSKLHFHVSNTWSSDYDTDQFRWFFTHVRRGSTKEAKENNTVIYQAWHKRRLSRVGVDWLPHPAEKFSWKWQPTMNKSTRCLTGTSWVQWEVKGNRKDEHKTLERLHYFSPVFFDFPLFLSCLIATSADFTCIIQNTHQTIHESTYIKVWERQWLQHMFCKNTHYRDNWSWHV